MNVTPQDAGGMLEFQRSLHDALNYWLYSSNSSFSMQKLRGSNHTINVRPLVRCARVLQKTGVSFARLAPHTSPDGKSTTEQYAQTLAYYYLVWEQTVPKGNSPRDTIPLSHDFKSWSLNGGHDDRYRSVSELYRLLSYHDELFVRAILHGSVATLDDTPGFSDLDLAFVIRTEALKNPRKLLQLRKLATEILALTYAFDPFMHHGPYYISEIDLAWYPEAMFPPVLFKYGVDLLIDPDELEIRTRPSEKITDQMLDMFERFFEKWPSSPFRLKDSYDIEWVIGNAMILPALYLQRKTGAFHYKRDAFPLSQQDFSVEEWEPIGTATKLRASLGPRPKPSRLLVWISRKLNWPGLLQSWARRHPLSIQRAQEAIEILGLDYPDRVLRLLRSMRGKLPQAATKAVKICAPEPNGFAACKYFAHICDGALIDMPLETSEQRYDSATELLVSHWSSLRQQPVAIYQIGTVGAPGISDLDFVIVFPDGKSIDWTQYKPKAFPQWVQKLMTHSPYCCAESSWSQLPAWYPTFQLRHLWGEELPVPVIPDDLKTGCALGMLVDYLLVKVPRDFLWIAWERPLRVRTIVAMLYSLKYTIKLAKRAGIVLPNRTENTISRVEALRTSWFDQEASQRMEMVAQLCDETCEIAGMIIHQVDAELLHDIKGKQTFQKNSIVRSDSLFNFTTPWIFEAAMRSAFKYYSRSGQITWTNPVSFSQILAVYADESPQFQKYLQRKGCTPTLQWDGGLWIDGLRYHLRAMIQYRASAAKLGVPPQKYLALGFSPQVPRWRGAASHTRRLLKGEIRLTSILRRI